MGTPMKNNEQPPVEEVRFTVTRVRSRRNEDEEFNVLSFFQNPSKPLRQVLDNLSKC